MFCFSLFLLFSPFSSLYTHITLATHMSHAYHTHVSHTNTFQPYLHPHIHTTHKQQGNKTTPDPLPQQGPKIRRKAKGSTIATVRTNRKHLRMKVAGRRNRTFSRVLNVLFDTTERLKTSQRLMVWCSLSDRQVLMRACRR